MQPYSQGDVREKRLDLCHENCWSHWTAYSKKVKALGQTAETNLDQEELQLEQSFWKDVKHGSEEEGAATQSTA